MINQRYRKLITPTLIILSFIIGVAFSFFFIQNNTNFNTGFQEKHQSGFKFISPLLQCDSYQEIAIKQRNNLRNYLIDYINQRVNENRSLDISVYFRDLNNGPWIGINEKNEFSPASLLKVPILIAYLKKSETDPLFLEQTTQVTVSTGVTQIIVPSQTLDVTKKYSIRDLLYHMIAYSDNNATTTLFDFISTQGLKDVYSDLGLTMPFVDSYGDSITSVREYSSFFRILYNSSYLSRASSEKALELLSNSLFKDGIVAGVAKGTIVAHKFGERQIGNQELYQLHDCGIVYYPKKPYLLCIMTRGNTKNSLPKVIADISRIVYRTINTAK